MTKPSQIKLSQNNREQLKIDITILSFKDNRKLFKCNSCTDRHLFSLLASPSSRQQEPVPANSDLCQLWWRLRSADLTQSGKPRNLLCQPTTPLSSPIEERVPNFFFFKPGFSCSLGLLLDMTSDAFTIRPISKRHLHPI